MSELFKEMCFLSGKLNDLIAEKEFDENDDFYIDTIEKIMDTERLIKDFKAKQLNLINIFVHIIDIIANVEKIILGWKISSAK
jgi:hypothetical protein